jgi:hypothetical protein
LQYFIVGALQGVALWLLYEGVRRGDALPVSPRMLAALFYACIAGPLAWYLTLGAFTAERTRLMFVLLVAVLFAGLGAHAASVSGAAAPWLWPEGLAIPTAVLGFLVVSLACGWDVARRRFDYPRLFELAWRNAVLTMIAAALTGAFWIVLVAGAWLTESIGLHGLRKLYGEAAFAIPVTGAVLGVSFGLALARAHIVVGVRHLVLSLAIWFLPITLLFAVAWVIALPFAGVQPLFSTGNAAFYVLWFATLAIVFVNTAFQDGSQAPAYPRWLGRALAWAWLAMPLLALLAGWALWQRIAQHGWTPDRIWAAVVWLLITIYAIGYAASVFRRGAWMHTVAATNIVAALLQVVLILALISPLADVRWLTAASQTARLRSGAVPPSRFDWNLLLQDTGRYGREALQALAGSAGPDEHSKAIATQAADILRTGRAPSQLQDRDAALQALRERVAVRPRAAVPDPTLLEWLARPNAEWHERNCIARPDACALWITDLDGDKNDEAILLWDQRGGIQGTLYSRASGAWRKEGSFRDSSRSLAAWLAEIEAGRVSTAAPKWLDLMLGGDRIRIMP